MLLDAVIVLLVVVPIALVVILRRRKDLTRSPGKIVGELGGVLLLVCGLLLLFVAFYLLMVQGATPFNLGVLVVTLALVLGGFTLTRWAERRPELEGPRKAGKP